MKGTGVRLRYGQAERKKTNKRDRESKKERIEMRASYHSKIRISPK